MLVPATEYDFSLLWTNNWRCNARRETFKSRNLLQATRRLLWSAMYLKEKAWRMQRCNKLYGLCPFLPHLQYSLPLSPTFHKRNRNATVHTRYVVAWRGIIVRKIFICVATTEIIMPIKYGFTLPHKQEWLYNMAKSTEIHFMSRSTFQLLL